MSENCKRFISTAQVVHWTGDNKAEIEEFLAHRLSVFECTLSVDSEDGGLVASNTSFWGSIGYTNLPLGAWASIGGTWSETPPDLFNAVEIPDSWTVGG